MPPRGSKRNSTTKLQDLFGKYADVHSSGSQLKMGPEGVSQFLEDLDLDPLDVIPRLTQGESTGFSLAHGGKGYGVLHAGGISSRNGLLECR